MRGTGLGASAASAAACKPCDGHAVEQVGRHVVEALVGTDLAGHALRRRLGERAEHRRDVLERLALEQPGEQQVAFLPQRQLVVEVDVVATGQQPARLQLDERGGDQQELGGDVEVEGLQPLDLGEVGVDDACQADLVDVDLFRQDQVQEQVERALVDRGRHIDRHRWVRRYPPATAWWRMPPIRDIGFAIGIHTRFAATRSVALRGVTRVLSCIQPTGDVHLGNYLGALRNWVRGQHDKDVFHGIVDLHALTVTEQPGVVGAAHAGAGGDVLRRRPRPRRGHGVRAEPRRRALAAGVGDGVQRQLGELSRMTQFKEKSAKRSGGFISGGLFTYPALQAADILLYDTDEVPVGEDQRQHVEITRDIAIRFNSRFGETFVLPEAVTPPAGGRVMDLQNPTSKMSKTADSDAGLISLLDDPATIARKFKRAVTDSETEVRYDPVSKPGVSNLLQILAALNDCKPDDVAPGYTQYGQLKQDAGEAVIEVLRPIQARTASCSTTPPS